MKPRYAFRFWRLVIFLSLLLVPWPLTPATSAQVQNVGKAVDMMIVIDNSCSMFPKEKATAPCESWGNDPDFLRIVGADLFIARLGFSEFNEAEYQAGIVGLGRTPELISPLQPLSSARDAMASAIADPSPETATGIVPALEMAYAELQTSPSRRPENLPVVILITDGIPYPQKGQSNDEIQELVAQYAGIPLFIMLLQNPDAVSPGYQEYVRFWGQLQNKFTHIRTYPIADASQIEETYNNIIAQLQNTVPTEGIGVAPGTPLQVFVSRYVQRIILTVIHDRHAAKGIVTITDPDGQVVADGQAGVDHFRGDKNPVEVFSILAPRLSQDLKEDYWTVNSDAPVIVFLDRQGAYSINFLQPKVSLTDITNIYLATERWTPSKEFMIRFSLLDENKLPVLDPQPIQGIVAYPDGREENLRIPSDLLPDAAGVYEIRFDFATAYPPAINAGGRFTFAIEAGSADDRAHERIAIANARLLVDVGRGCYIEDVAPQPVVCGPGQSAKLTVTLGDLDTCRMDTLVVRVLAGAEEAVLTLGVNNTFEGDVGTLCVGHVSGLSCGTDQQATWRVRMVGEMLDGSYLSPSEHDVPVQLVAAACPPTATPIPTATSTPLPTPTPSPTPCPDRDRDGLNDCGQDACPDQRGPAQLDGCPIPLWVWPVGGLLLLGVIALVVFVLWPWLRVRLSPPPRASMEIFKAGRKVDTKYIHNVGLQKRTNQVTIGGNRDKAHIYVDGLKPIEFVIRKEGDKVVVFDAEKRIPKATVTEHPVSIYTSNSEVRLQLVAPKANAKSNERKYVRP